MQNITVFVIGFVVHVIFLYSIFDIYFTSPLVHGMTHFKPGSSSGLRTDQINSQLKPPAKRLVLFVADGLRADSAFELDENGKPRAPFLRRMIENEGSWAISHTRVPTESRPGHVALIAGFYEDVSAVAKGWKVNPVDFDSVFNQSRHTWSWGSPDILPMFAKGASGGHVHVFMYPAESEDFAGADSSRLDTWVFDKVQEFLDSSRKNKTLSAQLHEDGVILFLHLLGIDVNGHSYRPHSKEYLSNIRVVDDGIRMIVNKLEGYYGNDGKTAFVFTADHGMTDWAWKLAGYRRHDVQQGDVAALMTSLLGLNFPANNVGVVPADLLATGRAYKAECMLANLMEIHAQYQVKMDQKKSISFSLFFKAYPAGDQLDDVIIRRRYQRLVGDGKYQEAIEYCRTTIQTALEGLQYYHQYDRLFLGTSIALGFLGWMAYVLVLVVYDTSGAARSRRPVREPRSNTAKILAVVVCTATVLFLFLQSLPPMYYVYCLTPILLWYLVLVHLHQVTDSVKRAYRNGICSKLAAIAVVWALGLELIVVSFFHREILTLGLMVLAVFPLATQLPTKHTKLAVGWFVCCAVLSIFPLLPVIGRGTNYAYVWLAIGLTLGLHFCFYTPAIGGDTVKRENRVERTGSVVSIQLVILVMVLVIVHNTWISLRSKGQITTGWHLMSWSILGCTLVLPLLSSTKITDRLYSLTLSLLAVYYLLSIAHEGLFCLTLCVALYTWVRVETQLSSHGLQHINDFVEKREIIKDNSELSVADLRRAYTFIFFIMTSFYGTGNIASLNSFEPSSVYCFLTVFNPFVMAALLMLKILIPFLLVACAFQAILCSCRVRTRSLLLLVLFMSDFMGLHFFFLVRDSGSWLEIGTTISHYTIVMTMILALIVLMAAARGLTTFKWSREPEVSISDHKQL